MSTSILPTLDIDIKEINLLSVCKEKWHIVDMIILY